MLLDESSINKGDWLTTAMDEINVLERPFTEQKGSTMDGKKVIKHKIPFGRTEYYELLLKT